MESVTRCDCCDLPKEMCGRHLKTIEEEEKEIDRGLDQFIKNATSDRPR